MGAVPIYDLTTLLTTIASISASFVAILGGFIASKLISISENRSSTLDKLRSLDKEISVKISLKESLQDENNESDALDFIDANFLSFARNGDLDKLYTSLSSPSIEKEAMRPFWNIGQEVLSQYNNALQSHNYKTADEIQAIILKQYTCHLNFISDLFKVIQRQLEIFEHEQQQKIHSSSNSIYDRLSLTSASLFIPPPEVRSTLWDKNRYESNTQRIAEITNDLQLLNLQKKQYEFSIPSLKHPKGMISGLFIFAFITVTSIVIPIALIPFCTESYTLYLFVRYIFIILFVTDLLLILVYLMRLLNWKEIKEV